MRILFLFLLFINISSSSILNSRVIVGKGSGCSGNYSLGSILSTFAPVDPRVNLQQLRNTFVKIVDSTPTTLKYVSELGFSFSVGPIDQVSMSISASNQCCSQSFQTQNDVLVYSVCVNGPDTTFFMWILTFDSIDSWGCDNCLKTLCPTTTSVCSNCDNDCSHNKMETSGIIQYYTKNSTEDDNIKERNIHRENLRIEKMYNYLRTKVHKKMYEPNESQLFLRQDYGEEYTEIIIPSKIHKECPGLGSSGLRQLELFTGKNEEYYLFFTPSQDVLSEPTMEKLNFLCIGTFDKENVTINPAFDATELTSEGVASVTIPLLTYSQDDHFGIVLYCQYVPSDTRNMVWRLTLRMTFDFYDYVEAMDVQDCPDQVNGQVRRYNDTVMEVLVVTAWPQSTQTYSFFMVCDFDDPNSRSCYGAATQTHQPIYILSDEEYQAGSRISNVYVGVFEESKIIITSSIRSPENKETLLIFEAKDWREIYTIENLLSVEKDPSGFYTLPFDDLILIYFITTIPNNNIRLETSSGEDDQRIDPDHIKAEILYDSLFITYLIDQFENFTTIFSCPPGQFFLLNPRGCWPCPPGQYKNSSSIGKNCELCPSDFYNPNEGSSESGECQICKEGYYCPSGTSKQIVYPPTTTETLSCSDPWFEDSEDVDLEGSFYINQGLSIFLICVLVVILCYISTFLFKKTLYYLSEVGVWMWEMEETDPHLKKVLWGIAALGALLATILLITFFLYLLADANTFIETKIDVQNSVSSDYPNQYQNLVRSPIYISLVLRGRFKYCELKLFEVKTQGFFNIGDGSPIDMSSSTFVYGDNNSTCYIQINVPPSIQASLPKVSISYFSLSHENFIHISEVELSTNLNENGRLMKCSSDNTVTQNENLKSICDSFGFSYASIQILALQNRTIRGETDITVTKTLGIVEDCKSKYNSNPFSFATTKKRCSYCGSSTVVLFPSKVKSDLQSSTFFYEEDPTFYVYLNFESDHFARTASISQYLSVGSALLLLLVTSMGLQEIWELALAFGWYMYLAYCYLRKKNENSQQKVP